MLALLPAATGAANPSSHAGVPASHWVVTDLGNLGMAKVTVSDINDRGQVVGEGATRDGLGRGFIWQDGSMTALGQGQFAAAQRINERGQIMGMSSSAAFADEHAVLWKNKKMIDLHGGYPEIWASAINDRGQIVGERNANAFMWQAGTFRTLWPDGVALAVNNRGQVLGASAAHAGLASGEAMLWQAGKSPTSGLVRQRSHQRPRQIVGIDWIPAVRLRASDHKSSSGRSGRRINLLLGTGVAWTPRAINDRGRVTKARSRSGISSTRSFGKTDR
jgi:probable HAF family extracellular repeat protein